MPKIGARSTLYLLLIFACAALALILSQLRHQQSNAPTIAPIEAPRPTEVIPPEQSTPRTQAKSPKKATTGYSFKKVLPMMGDQRVAWTRCALSQKRVASPLFQLTIQWTPKGEFHSIHSDVPLDSPVSDCITKTLTNWKISPHPDGKPIELTIPIRFMRGR